MLRASGRSVEWRSQYVPYDERWCPDPPAGWAPADPTTSEPTTTPKSMTTTPAPLCDGETSPFSLAGSMLCVPNKLYPAPGVSHCVLEDTWEHVVENKHHYKAGGLGRKMRDGWGVWVCMEHPCCADKDDRVCFTYSEEHRVFVPWGYNRHLHLFKK